jgi:serine/threonine-protein kinase
MDKPDLQNDRYELLERLGEGGVAVVWKAWDHETGAPVAIKIVHEEALDLRTIQRLAQEVEILTGLDHPHVVKVLATGVCKQGPLPYVVMEFVAGDTLRDRMNEQDRLPVPYALEVTQQICAGLQVAHQMGVVHRDLKPENVMMSVHRDPFCKIVDFGMAKVLSPEAAVLTTNEALCGTPEYMPPERARGQPVTGLSDVYSVGIMVYEMLTGARPFEGDSPIRVMTRQVQEPAPPMQGVHQALQRPVLMALEKQPDKRPDAGALARTLTDAVRRAGF